MSDNYIDYWEVSEYGPFFVRESARLKGASPVVNIDELGALVTDAVEGVHTELTKAGITRSALRTSDVGALATAALGELRSFYYSLKGLGASVAIDRNAFFPGGKLDAPGELKPADLEKRLGAVLLGFEAEANKALPDHEERRAKLADARDALRDALHGKGATAHSKLAATRELKAARERFLLVYNRVAKPAVKALLALLDRADEYPGFFLDLQVGEDGDAAVKPPEPPKA